MLLSADRKIKQWARKTFIPKNTHIWMSAWTDEPNLLEFHLHRSWFERRLLGKADINQRNPYHDDPLSTALHAATEASNASIEDPIRRANNLKVCSILLKRGADLHTLVNKEGRTVFDEILNTANSTLPECKQYAETLIRLCQRHGKMTRTMYAQAEKRGIRMTDKAISNHLRRPDNSIANAIARTQNQKPNQQCNDLSAYIATFLSSPPKEQEQ
jgi:hypothetical protein